MNLKDKELKSIITTDLDFDSEKKLGVKGQRIYLKENVKESIQDYKLYMEMKCYHIVSEGFKEIKQKLYNKYNVDFTMLDRFEAYYIIFGDFENK